MPNALGARFSGGWPTSGLWCAAPDGGASCTQDLQHTARPRPVLTTNKDVTGVNKVYVTRQLPQSALDRLKGKVEYAVNPEDRVLEREELLAAVADVDGLLALLTDTIDAEVFDAAPKLKIVANYAVGVNNIDVAEATRRGIVVTNTPGVLTETTADLTWALRCDSPTPPEAMVHARGQLPGLGADAAAGSMPRQRPWGSPAWAHRSGGGAAHRLQHASSTRRLTSHRSPSSSTPRKSAWMRCSQSIYHPVSCSW